MKSYGLLAAAALAVLWATGCSRSESEGKDARNVPAASEAAGEKRFALTGEVIRVDADRKVLVIRHEEVAGFMPAMTMEFKAGAGDLALAKPGQRIRAELVTSKGGEVRLEKVWPDDKANADAVAAAARKLREDTHNLGKNAYREVGEKAPDFALYDQGGRLAPSTRFAGKQIMLNFIFTRCPVANMCPAATLKMVSVQKLARDAGVKNLELISITLDPAFDTPGVLREYAEARGIDLENFSFLTGPENAVKDLLAQFGVLAEFKGDLLVHTLATLLIDEHGKIIHRTDGSMWDPQEFVARMKRG